MRKQVKRKVLLVVMAAATLFGVFAIAAPNANAVLIPADCATRFWPWTPTPAIGYALSTSSCYGDFAQGTKATSDNGVTKVCVQGVFYNPFTQTLFNGPQRCSTAYTWISAGNGGFPGTIFGGHWQYWYGNTVGTLDGTVLG